MQIDQIEQGKQINPNDVDEVPVQTADFDGGVIFGREAALPGHPEKTIIDFARLAKHRIFATHLSSGSSAAR